MQTDIMYQTFERAILAHDDTAWSEINTRYRPLMICWASRFRASVAIDEFNEDIADQALARAWSALAAQRFEAFPSLAALLAYLRQCVRSTVMDCARAQHSRTRLLQSIASETPINPEEVVVDTNEYAELWSNISALAKTPAEQVVLVESFVYDLPPREIAQRHPQLFSSVAAVYASKRNLLERLQRNEELRERYAGSRLA